MNPIHLILVIAALVCFLLATFNVQTKINVGWLGAALLTLTLLI